MIIYPMMLGGWEIAIIVLVILILVGGRKIPELMAGLGKGIKNFKEGIKEDGDTNKDASADKKE